MATITYSNFAFCTAGDHNSGHLSIDVTLNSVTRRVTYEVADLISPLGNLSAEDRERLAMLILKVHFAGRTRVQVRNEINAGPVTVTI
jgi:hypothetical protein